MNQKIDEIKMLMPQEIQDFFERIQKVKIQEQTSQETCIICYNAQISIFGEPLPCGHVFHLECIKAWIKYQNKCPYCKHKVV